MCIRDSLDTLGISISQLETTRTDFQGVVGSYQDLINRYRSMIQSLQAAMLRLVTIVPLMVTFFLFWLAMLQLLVLIKGWHWLRGGNAKPEPVTVSAAPVSYTHLDVYKRQAVHSGGGGTFVSTQRDIQASATWGSSG